MQQTVQPRTQFTPTASTTVAQPPPAAAASSGYGAPPPMAGAAAGAVWSVQQQTQPQRAVLGAAVCWGLVDNTPCSEQLASAQKEGARLWRHKSVYLPRLMCCFAYPPAYSRTCLPASYVPACYPCLPMCAGPGMMGMPSGSMAPGGLVGAGGSGPMGMMQVSNLLFLGEPILQIHLVRKMFSIIQLLLFNAGELRGWLGVQQGWRLWVLLACCLPPCDRACCGLWDHSWVDWQHQHAQHCQHQQQALALLSRSGTRQPP